MYAIFYVKIVLSDPKYLWNDILQGYMYDFIDDFVYFSSFWQPFLKMADVLTEIDLGGKKTQRIRAQRPREHPIQVVSFEFSEKVLYSPNPNYSS